MKKKNYIQSFKYAFNGILSFFKLEPNAIIHLLLGSIAIIIALFSNLNAPEWVLILLAISIVFICEMFNTAIETLCNFVSPEKQEAIKKVKDLSAGAVLIASIFALATALLILAPKWI